MSGPLHPSDREMLAQMSPDEVEAFLDLHIRNLWRVDGLYFLGIEERFGTEAATEIDAACWKTMATLEARALKKLYGYGQGSLAELMEALQRTSWSLDQKNKEIEVGEKEAVYRVRRCATQGARLRKGLSEFPCKRVRHGYLEIFAREINPAISMTCRFCPPDPHPDDAWCEWVFTIEGD